MYFSNNFSLSIQLWTWLILDQKWIICSLSYYDFLGLLLPSWLWIPSLERGGWMWSLEAQSCKMNPTLSVIICYLGSLPSPRWKTVFHSSCFCCCCCLVFWVLFLTFQQMTPCRNGFRQVCLRQKKDGQGKCTAYFHTLALGNYLLFERNCEWLLYGI